MEIKDKTKIKINFLGLFNKVKKEFKDDYFKLTFFYVAVYGLFCGTIVYGSQLLMTGTVEFNDLRSEMIIGLVTLMSTMATMAKRLKDDLVSNYWKLVKSGKRKRPTKNKKAS